MIDSNEQWLLDGDCTICRRRKYCSSPCTRCKREARANMQRIVADRLNEMTGGAMKHLIDNSIYTDD